MHRNLLAIAVSLGVIVLAALVYGSVRVTEHMQPERGQPTTDAGKGPRSAAPATTGAAPPNAQPATPSSGRDAVSNPAGGDAGNRPANAR
jgi:hypothetical protein